MNNFGNSWSKFDLTNNSTSKDENLEEPKSIDGNSSKKHYSVTTDDSRKRFIELWNSGTITIKQVSNSSSHNLFPFLKLLYYRQLKHAESTILPLSLLSNLAKWKEESKRRRKE